MKINPFAKSRASLALVTVLLLCFSSPSLRAEQFGLFTYRIVGGTTVEIAGYPPGVTGPVDIPAQIDGRPVTSIGGGAFNGGEAFYDCFRLTSVTIPGDVTSEDNGEESGTFGRCSGLRRAVFLGNAPSPDAGVFYGADPGFTISYISGSTGFTPNWAGYPTTMINETTRPAASWLQTHGFPNYTNLQQDPNGDGVSLLMAYALNLDLHLNLPGSLPQPVLGAGTLSLSFHAASPGITYTVKTSTDLKTRTTQGVVQTAPGPDGRATATVPRNSPNRFLRLEVAEAE